MKKGYLAFILHAHLPYVHHPEYENFLEERWLYEALTETYIPLLHVFEGLERDNVDFKITMTLSPTLVSMLQDSMLQERYRAHIRQLIDLTEREIERTADQPEFNQLAHMYNRMFEHSRHTFEERYGGDLTRGFKLFQDHGHLEIITCAATHGFLPILRHHPQAIRAQLRVAVEHYARVFDRPPRGIWLPECAYYQGLDKYLAEQELRFFIVESRGILLADPPPVYGLYAPIYCPSGVAAFGRDIESSRQVWSSKEGYPGDARYREFYRDVGFDLDLDYIKPYINPDGIRLNTGVKYFSITATGLDLGEKQPYHPEAAFEAADSHAANFQFNRERQVEYLTSVMDRDPIIVCPYDAELFGHWWFEGPLWMDLVLRKISTYSPLIELTTPSLFLAGHLSNQLAEPNPSSWGANSSYEVWINQRNSWIYPHLHAATEFMIELAQRFPEADGLLRRTLNQMARELMLLQSSDWPFIMTTGTAVEYAVKRFKTHVARFNHLREQILSNAIDEAYLNVMEQRDNIFPEIDYRVYL